MKVAKLLSSAPCISAEGSLDKEITAIAYHSDKAAENSLFFAVRGHLQDGGKYIKDAVSKGAVAIVTSEAADEKNFSGVKDLGGEPVTVIRTDDVRKAMAVMSAEFYGRPSEKMLVIGVTGTKGKTTVTFMIKEILEAAGIKTGIIGTVFTGWDGCLNEASSTTPQSADIQSIMRQMADNGCRAVVLEVSSQGLMHSRVESVDFDIGVFTNISPDHIGDGEHKDFEDYLFWKSSLFKMCKRGVINGDDPYARQIIDEALTEKTVMFGSKNEFDFAWSEPELTRRGGRAGVAYTLTSRLPCGDGKSRRIELNMPGRFNIQNSLAAIAVTSSLGIPMDTIGKVLRDIKIPGRVETVDTGRDFSVIIDYAHNGIALQNLMDSLREYSHGRIILVFGCGGNRDRNRRFEMGRVAAETADIAIITSDNPRREDPVKIIEDIESVMAGGRAQTIRVVSREEAIKRAIDEGRSGDIIVIAGKGHETYQIVGDRVRHLDDRETVMAVIASEERQKDI